MAWNVSTGVVEIRLRSAILPLRNISFIPDCGSSPDWSPYHIGLVWRLAGEWTSTRSVAKPRWNNASLNRFSFGRGAQCIPIIVQQ
jgi:hypothetical protein